MSEANAHVSETKVSYGVAQKPKIVSIEAYYKAEVKSLTIS
jgi:hypothetical protein